MTRTLGILLKIVAFCAVIAIICLAIGVEGYAFVEIYNTLSTIITGYTQEDEIIKKCLKGLDLVLLGVIFFSVATALFELYIMKIPKLPKWLVIDDLDGLKALMIKMVIFVMTISFTGRVVTYSGGIDILYLGGGLALVIGSLTYFLVNKNET
ncbi:YqhA family protein [Nonlabens antarcticus]|uniref:YqhA family protein n=1 Tax=Nonlabens antarcticus TaxID=392714 RepID=UPI001891DC6D|nr:YqhA family protein [Nonlabens antarcticus]